MAIYTEAKSLIDSSVSLPVAIGGIIMLACIPYNRKAYRIRRNRRYGWPYIVAVQFVAVVAAVVTLLWLGPEWCDIVLVYLDAGWRFSQFWGGC